VSVRTPSYRLHKPTGQAVVTLNGQDMYLGKYGTPESQIEYDRLVAEWLSNGRRLPQATGSDLAVNEFVVAYLKFADGYYRKGDAPTVEPGNIRLAVRPLLKLYGHSPARDFGPLKLKAVRQAMVDSGTCRTEVNRRVARIVRLFKWAVENELVPPAVHQALKAVAWLRKGRTQARESVPVKPVPDSVVDAIRLHVARQVWAMIELQRLTGMRPGEVVIMRTCDIDRTEAVWVYTPAYHKTEHHDKERHVYIGPRAQAVLEPWLRTDAEVFLFSPRKATEERWDKQRQNRKSKVQPSQRSRKRARPRKQPQERYTVASYRRAIAGGCDKAFPHPKEAEINGRRSVARTPAERKAVAAEWKSWRVEHKEELAVRASMAPSPVTAQRRDLAEEGIRSRRGPDDPRA